MLYVLADKFMPAYYQDYHPENYDQVRMDVSPLRSNPITALHYHRCFELGICISGRGTTYIENRVYHFSQGDIQIMPDGIPHLSVAEKGVGAVWCWIYLEPQRMLEKSGLKSSESFRKMADKCYNGVFHPWEYPQLAQLVNQIRELGENWGENGELSYTLLAGQLLLECARIGDADCAKSSQVPVPGKVMPAVHYIRANYADKEAMREAAIAQTCQMSTSHFRAVFKQETGMSVRDYIIQTRLVTAAQKLMDTGDSVMSIALETGFGQISCFNRIFLRVFGQTPTKFRKSARAHKNG